MNDAPSTPAQWAAAALKQSDAAGVPVALVKTEHLRALLAERDQLLQRVNPAAWTAPDGAVLDLSRQVFDRDGDAWTLNEMPPLTMTMVDGDRSDRTLPHLFEAFGPLTNEGEEL